MNANCIHLRFLGLLLPLLICTTFSALAITPPPGPTTNLPPIQDGGSAEPWDGSSSGDTPKPSRPPPGPCYQWEDGSPGEWIDLCEKERTAFIEAEKMFKDETEDIPEDFNRACGWWQEDLKKDYYVRINAAGTLSTLVCETISGVAGNLPAGLPSAITTGIQNGSSAANLVEALMGSYNLFFQCLTAVKLEKLKQDIQKQMDDQVKCIADFGLTIQADQDLMDEHKTKYEKAAQEFMDTLEAFLACCPEFEPEAIESPDFNCPEPVFDPMVPQGLRLPC
ncbi:MAG TPA: hypothetical protein PKX16_08410 [Kiritimatiellia bacterium]|jgi:hypothetical protein|nr:hypothetical protein [Kiritimatiellia bacterium]HQQ60519.1 hypothetical protein [Kiritimatiellia bacterium]